MKKLLLATATLFLSVIGFAQNEVTTETDGTKIIKGFITRAELANEPSFTWMAENQKNYTPNASTLQALKTYKDSVHILAFGGTWCGDTKHILPQVLSVADAAGFSPDRMTIIGVDRSKKTLQHLTEAFNVTRVPTFIVLKDGKEIGRVVEYGNIGMPDKEIGDIITAGFKK
jgi:thiol-disulfide isomerase/thioredoxin